MRSSDSGRATAIHPPEHCLPGSGWDVIDARIVPIDVGNGGEAKRFVIAKGNLRALVYFWYHSRGHVIARGPEKIVRMFFDRRDHRTDRRLTGALHDPDRARRRRRRRGDLPGIRRAPSRHCCRTSFRTESSRRCRAAAERPGRAPGTR